MTTGCMPRNQSFSSQPPGGTTIPSYSYQPPGGNTVPSLSYNSLSFTSTSTAATIPPSCIPPVASVTKGDLQTPVLSTTAILQVILNQPIN